MNSPHQGQTVLLLGATGLVGGHCLQRLIASPEVARVRMLVRHPRRSPHDKVEVCVADFNRLEQLEARSDGRLQFFSRFFIHNLLSLGNALVTDMTRHTGNQHIGSAFITATKGTFYFFVRLQKSFYFTISLYFYYG